MTTPQDWTLCSRALPSHASQAALCTDPRDGAAVLALVNGEPRAYERRGEGRGELWKWTGASWERTHRLLFPRPEGTPHGNNLVAWSDRASGRVLLGLFAEGLLRVIDPDEPTQERRYAHAAVLAHAGHGWAFADEREGGVWFVLGGENENVTLRLRGDELAVVATGEYLVTAAFDERAGSLVGHDVSRRGYRLAGDRWEREPSLDANIDAMVWDRTRDALVGLLVASDERMDAVEWSSAGWRPVRPSLFAPTYRNGTCLGVDEKHGQLLCFGGQDFEQGGEPSHQTLYGREGALDETRDPAVPPWGRYNTFFTTDDGLCVFDHGSRYIHHRVDRAWETVGRLEVPDGGYSDDRGLNAAWGDGALYVLDEHARLLRWTRDGGTTVACGPADEPGTFYAHRVAMGWDATRGALAVFGDGRARRVFLFERGAWRGLEASAAPVAGIAAGVGTPRGFYVLTRNALHLLRGESWVKVGPALEHPSYVLRHEPRRGALLAATPAGLWGLCDGAWRHLARLPEGASLRTMGSGDAELGVDPARDELVLCDGSSLWTLPLGALPLEGCALPTEPVGARRKRASSGSGSAR